MSNGYLKLFGNITESELKAVQDQYNEQCKKISEFQHRAITQNNGRKRSPKLKGYTLIYR